MVLKTFLYNGNLCLELSEKKFKLYPKRDTKAFSVLYDISMFSGEKLSLQIKADNKTRSHSLLILQRQDVEVLEISVEAPDLRTELHDNVYHSLKRDIKLSEDFKFQSNGGIIEVTYKYDVRVKHTVLTNPESNVHDVNAWLCGIWPPRCQCVEYCVCIDDKCIEELKSFADCSLTGMVSLDVTEKCYMFPITKDNVPTVVPWNEEIDVMIRTLSRILGIDQDKLQLSHGKCAVLDRHQILKIEDFRSEGSIDAPRMFFEVLGGKIRCNSMSNDENFTEVMVVGEKTASSVKRRLAFKMQKDERRFALSRTSDSEERHVTLLLNNADPVSSDDKLSFCIGLSKDDIIVKKLIGRGAYGRVYECTDARSNNKIVLKELIHHTSPKMDYRIRDLLFLLKGVSHRNIVRCLDIYIDDDTIACSMEYVDGGSLSDYLNKIGSDRGILGLEEDKIRQFTRDIVMGLKYLHFEKIIHRDVRGANVVLERDETAKLCDFGLSKILTDVNTRNLSEGINQTGEMGTRRWMAPEMARREKTGVNMDVKMDVKAGVKVDVWSLGATMVEMITGQIPFYGRSNAGAWVYLCMENDIPYEPPRPLSDSLKVFVDSCLTAVVIDRPNTQKLLALPFLQD